MINLEVETKLSVEEASKRLKSFFGKGGLGLDIVEETTECLNFAGSGGFVNAVICPAEGKTKIELQSQEWEIQVNEFASNLS